MKRNWSLRFKKKDEEEKVTKGRETKARITGTRGREEEVRGSGTRRKGRRDYASGKRGKGIIEKGREAAKGK